MELLKWKTEKRKVNDLIPYEENPRRMTEKELSDLKKSLEKFDLVEIPAIDIDNRIIAGHQRLKVLQLLGKGEEEIDVRVPNRKLTEKEFQEYNIRSNRNVGSWDWDLLAKFSKEMLLDIGWNELDIHKIFSLNEYCENKDELKKLSKIKILNLYSGIGGNRKLWGEQVNVTAVENNKEIAKVYQKLFPNDKVIIEDAHKYLEEHVNEFDFIWSSPPCPTHSKLRKMHKVKPKYPDMRLYEEILFLKGYHKGKWVVENVASWYKPLIEPQKRGRHYYWANFEIFEDKYPQIIIGSIEKWRKIDIKAYANKFYFNLEDIPKIKEYSRATILRNLIHPKEGRYILECAYLF